jgi:hypothetical protein
MLFYRIGATVRMVAGDNSKVVEQLIGCGIYREAKFWLQ